jgi:hypothetical protein
MIRHGSPSAREAVAALPAMPPFVRSLPAVIPTPGPSRNRGQNMRGSPLVPANILFARAHLGSLAARPAISQNPKLP